MVFVDRTFFCFHNNVYPWSRRGFKQPGGKLPNFEVANRQGLISSNILFQEKKRKRATFLPCHDTYFDTQTTCCFSCWKIICFFCCKPLDEMSATSELVEIKTVAVDLILATDAFSSDDLKQQVLLEFCSGLICIWNLVLRNCNWMNAGVEEQ